MKVRIDIDTRTFVRFWLVVIGFALAIVAVVSARQALSIIGAALFLALALNPPVNRIARLLPGRSRVGGTALAYVAVLIVLAIVVFLVVPPIIAQTVKFAQTVPDLIKVGSKQYAGLNTLVTQYHLHSQVSQLTNSIKNSATTFATSLGKNVLSGLGSLVTTITSTILILVLAFLMLVEGPEWMKKIWDVYNDEKRMEHHKTVVHKMYTVVTGYVIGQLSVSAIDGLTGGLAVLVLSFFFPSIAPNLAIPAAAIIFVLSLIPLFGAMIGGAIVTIILLLNSLTAAIVFVIIFIVYQQIESNLISPRIQSKKLDLSALAILCAVTIGIYLFGIAGGIISIPIAGCIRVLIEDYLAQAKLNRIASVREDAKEAKEIQAEA